MEQEKQESEKPELRRRYKFSHYILEFFMIVLAVTVGFFVDDYRDYRSEREEEIEYMKSLLEDLEADRISLEEVQTRGALGLDGADSLLLNLTKDPKGNEGRLYHFFILANAVPPTFYSDRTTSQLKSSGKFRVIQSNKVAKTLMKYDADIRYLIDFRKQLALENSARYSELFETIFDLPMAFSRFDSIYKYKNKPDEVIWPKNLKLVTYDKLILQRFKNSLYYSIETDRMILRYHNQLSKQNIKLDSLIRIEYRGMPNTIHKD